MPLGRDQGDPSRARGMLCSGLIRLNNPLQEVCFLVRGSGLGSRFPARLYNRGGKRLFRLVECRRRWQCAFGPGAQ